jgi:hypothetical protein
MMHQRPSQESDVDFSKLTNSFGTMAQTESRICNAAPYRQPTLLPEGHGLV